MLHGGEIYGRDRILYDFSVNINPLGVPENVTRQLSVLKGILERYPDQDCGQLRKALGEFTGVPAENILCGNGASELIEAALRTIRPGRVLLTAPSFSGYRRAAQNCGAQILYHVLRREEDFRLTERFLQDLETFGGCGDTGCPAGAAQAAGSPAEASLRTAGRSGPGTSGGADLVILCSPSNPVGNLIDPSLLEKIALACARKGIWLMVDECFLGFMEDEERRTMRRYLAQGPCRTQKGTGDGRQEGLEAEAALIAGRLLVVDAFTKRFAMPGIRLGYLMAADRELLRRIHAQQPEWSVSGPAQTAGLAALEDAEAYMGRARQLVKQERRRMAAALERSGFTVFPGEANYIFFSEDLPGNLSEVLLKKGILIRDCENYPGLGKGYYRAAVKCPEENDILLRALEEYTGYK